MSTKKIEVMAINSEEKLIHIEDKKWTKTKSGKSIQVSRSNTKTKWRM